MSGHKTYRMINESIRPLRSNSPDLNEEFTLYRDKLVFKLADELMKEVYNNKSSSYFNISKLKELASSIWQTKKQSSNVDAR